MSKMMSFKLAAQLTFTTVAAEVNRLTHYCQTQSLTHLTLDASQVINCDSAGLSLFIEATRVAHRYRKTCYIINLTPAVAALAEFCGLEKILTSTVPF